MRFVKNMDKNPLFMAIIVMYLAPALHVSGTDNSIAEFFRKMSWEEFRSLNQSDRRRLTFPWVGL